MNLTTFLLCLPRIAENTQPRETYMGPTPRTQGSPLGSSTKSLCEHIATSMGVHVCDLQSDNRITELIGAS